MKIPRPLRSVVKALPSVPSRRTGSQVCPKAHSDCTYSDIKVHMLKVGDLSL
jgi:hypothetical protein